MKRFLAIAMLCGLAVSSARADLLLAFDFAGYAGSEVQGTSTVSSVGIAPNALITRGAGLTASANGDRFNAQGWDGFTTASDALTGNNYFEFSITPTGGNLMTITSVFFQVQRSNTGASNLVLRSSADSYATDLGSLINFANATVTTPLTVNLSGNSSFENLSAPLTFRIIGYTGASGGSTGFEGTGNDIQVFGSVVPEPGSVVLFGMGVALIATLRRRTQS